LKFAASGLVGLAPTMSGYSVGGFVDSTLAINPYLLECPGKCKSVSCP